MSEQETILSGGRTAASVVRIGNTVHRSISPNAEFSQAFLTHLQKHDFNYAPKFLGVDEQGREILSYIEGEVPNGDKITLPQIITCVKVMRQFHDIASLSTLKQDHETICHLDFAPWNVIFKDHEFVGIIDFDDSRPGKRVDDLAYLIWTFLDLGTSNESDNKQLSSMKEICKAYDLRDVLQLGNALLEQQYRILKFRQHIVDTEVDIEKRKFSEIAIKNIRKSMEWVKTNSSRINAFTFA